jgi:hypothetical protein
MKEQMARRIKTAEGRNIYNNGKETVEPVFGIMSLPAVEGAHCAANKLAAGY